MNLDSSYTFKPASSKAWILLAQLTAIFLCVYVVFTWITGQRKTQAFIEQVQKPAVGLDEAEVRLLTYPLIQPLPDFKWEDTNPLQLRPFKPKYHLTMAITNIDASYLLEMDKTYLSRIQLRRQIMEQHTSTVLAANHCIKPAVDELYTWLIGSYLPTRFPRMFQLNEDSPPETSLVNLVTKELIPITPPPSAVEALRVLGSHVDEDFLFLLPASDTPGTYTLQGFVGCFPNGFDSSTKLGLKLADIHAPVPGYKEKLEKSMDRFFTKLEVGRFVARANWSISQHDKLFAAFVDMHNYDGDSDKAQNIDIPKVNVRCERQTLHRLPQTRALVFGFKTYLYSLMDLKAEGHVENLHVETNSRQTDGEKEWEEHSTAEQLAQAIEGLGQGNVPSIAFYKRQPVWGPDVVKYLRS